MPIREERHRIDRHMLSGSPGMLEYVKQRMLAEHPFATIDFAEDATGQYIEVIARWQEERVNVGQFGGIQPRYYNSSYPDSTPTPYIATKAEKRKTIREQLQAETDASLKLQKEQISKYIKKLN